MAGTREMKKPALWKRPGVLAGTALGVVLGAYLALCVWVGGSGVLPNVTLGGLEVSGMTQHEVQALLERELEEHSRDAAVTLTYGSWRGTITADQLQMNPAASAQRAWNFGREGFFGRGTAYLRQLMGEKQDVFLELSGQDVEQPALRKLVQEAARAVDEEVVQATWELAGDRLMMTKGRSGKVIMEQESQFEVEKALVWYALPAAFAGNVEEPTVELNSVTMSPDTPDFAAIAAQLCGEPKDAFFDAETRQIVPHVTGVAFAAADLQAAYEVAAEGETFSIPVALTQPAETTDSLNSKLFAHLLGEGTSRVGGSANRKFNVKLSAEACNGVILMPGEEFSYNNTTGSRSADKGYLAAPVYSGGASVDEVGGGICQTSSTIYYAVLHSTLEIVERSAHMYATGYVPDGMDATVYFGALDFRFKNNTNYPIKIVTQSYDKNGSRYLKASIYGTNETGRYAIPERTQFDWVEPTKKYVADETIPQGTIQVDEKQNPYTGRRAQVYRYIYEKDGTLVEKQDLGVSRYKMRPETIYYNPKDGDPTTWVNGQPPKPVVVQPEPVPEPVPETPVMPPVSEELPPVVPVPDTALPEQPAIQEPVEQPVPENEIPVDPN